MEINEKLDIFYRAAIEAANGKSEEILKEQEQIYTQSIESYEKKKKEELDTRIRIVHNQVEKEENRVVSEALLELKKQYHVAQEQKKEELFALVKEKLQAYRKTEGYLQFLAGKMSESKKYAGGSPIVIYLDPEDAMWFDTLQEQAAGDEAQMEVLLSKESFGGGMRAVIREKNLLMDESFDRKLAEEKEVAPF